MVDHENKPKALPKEGIDEKVAGGVWAKGPPVAVKVIKSFSASVASTLKFKVVPATIQVSLIGFISGDVLEQESTSICISLKTEPI